MMSIFNQKKQCRDASDLDLQPGRFPTELRFEGRLYRAKRSVKVVEELVSVIYVTEDGHILEVLND